MHEQAAPLPVELCPELVELSRSVHVYWREAALMRRQTLSEFIEDLLEEHRIEHFNLRVEHRSFHERLLEVVQ